MRSSHTLDKRQALALPSENRFVQQLPNIPKVSTVARFDATKILSLSWIFHIDRNIKRFIGDARHGMLRNGDRRGLETSKKA